MSTHTPLKLLAYIVQKFATRGYSSITERHLCTNILTISHSSCLRRLPLDGSCCLDNTGNALALLLFRAPPKKPLRYINIPEKEKLDRVMDHTVSCQPPPRGGGSFRYQVMDVRFMVNKAKLRQVFLRVLRFPCQYGSTSAPYSSLSTCCSYQKEKGAKSENLLNSNVLSKNRESVDKKLFSLLSLKRKSALRFQVLTVSRLQ
jgi:hypothetical protein